MQGAAASSSIKLLFALITFRLMNAILVRTYFVPDELFQSVEVAHWAVYGTGYVSWEWKWSLRSVLHPACFAVLYQLGQALGLDSSFYVTEVPRLFHALLYAVSDFCFYKLAGRVLGSRSAAKYALLSYLSCWFVWYCAPRTLSNTLETVLMLYALQWYPVTPRDVTMRTCWPYVSVGFVSVLIRPTSLLIWIPFGILHLWRSKSPLKLMLNVCVPACLPILLFTFLLDSAVYSRWTLTVWNFVRFNVFEGGSAHFGSHPWYWFLLQGLPATLAVQLIPIVGGIVLALRNLDRFSAPPSPPLVFLVAPVVYIVVHSFIAHKEHRFLLPIVPLLCLFAGHFFDSVFSRWKKKIMGSYVAQPRIWLGLLLVVNVPLALYLGLYHQVGAFTTTRWINNDVSRRFSKAEDHFGIVQLMPCFSLPQYSHSHGLNVTITALDCSPNLHHISNYVDQADQFHFDPNRWIAENVDLLKAAHYVVFYEKTYRKVEDLISSLNFRLCARLFYAHFLSSPRQDQFIVIACR